MLFQDCSCLPFVYLYYCSLFLSLLSYCRLYILLFFFSFVPFPSSTGFIFFNIYSVNCVMCSLMFPLLLFNFWLFLNFCFYFFLFPSYIFFCYSGSSLIPGLTIVPTITTMLESMDIQVQYEGKKKKCMRLVLFFKGVSLYIYCQFFLFSFSLSKCVTSFVLFFFKSHVTISSLVAFELIKIIIAYDHLRDAMLKALTKLLRPNEDDFDDIAFVGKCQLLLFRSSSKRQLGK